MSVEETPRCLTNGNNASRCTGSDVLAPGSGTDGREGLLRSDPCPVLPGGLAVLPVQSVSSESRAGSLDSCSPAGADGTMEPPPQSWEDLCKSCHSVGLGHGWATLGVPQGSRGVSNYASPDATGGPGSARRCHTLAQREHCAERVRRAKGARPGRTL